MSTAAICTSYLEEILQGVHAADNTYKIALYTSASSLNHTTTVYTATDEVSGAGYTAGGQDLENFDTGSSGKFAWIDFSDVIWDPSTITARYALIYNSSVGNKAVCVLDFLTNKSSTAGPFEIQFPAPAASTALLRITGP